ncbi:hypothetical protein EJ08DRAFT_593535 [Tothia fuscella]|uniref:Peptidase S54 rhomboid domain-containing protein n=1 Tax=Tothia fuscella TaxID=1048955 RepID=A0A9P4TVR2_9PEZI|nr:hypothetical protein EJ08DRAFT_593535 [Tothia fuscella]
MHSSGFKNAPVSQVLFVWTVAASIIASITDTKYYFYIQVVPHLWVWRQFWRLFAWQICYTNSAEVLVAALTFYQLRVIERLWGSRKLASFVVLTLPYTLILPPLILALLIRPLSLNKVNYLPAGPTSILFALLAQYHAAIPSTYKYRIGATAAPPPPNSNRATSAFMGSTVTLTSKTMSYLLPLQLALSRFPSAILPAVVGWAIGYAYRNDVLPGTSWRVPAWVVGQKSVRPNVEALRRRLEGEGANGNFTSAMQSHDTEIDEARQRGRTGQLLGEQFFGRVEG